MNRDHEIYSAPDPPAEDVARLDGYLKGRADEVVVNKSRVKNQERRKAAKAARKRSRRRGRS